MKLFFTSVISALVLSISAQAPTFSFNINGSVPAGFANALTVAGQKWSQYLVISVPIKVNVSTVNSGALPFSAITIANARRNFANAPVTNTLYTTALANQIAGVETNPGQYDMDIVFNLNTPFYFGTVAPTASQQDFITTAMHEIGHGLGFYSDGYVDNSGKGSFGNIPPSAIWPLTPSFPWRGQDSVPGIFDKYIVKQSGNSLVALAAGTIAPQNSTALGDSIKNNAHYFSGPLYANASHSNTPVRLSGGAGTFTMGVDLLHIHQSYANTIMSYYWGLGDTVRIPGPWELGILKEIGWNLKSVGLRENQIASFVSVYPVPASDKVLVRGNSISEVKVFDSKGDLVLEEANAIKAEELELNTKNLPEGLYLLKVAYQNSAQTSSKKILVKH